MSIGGPHEVLPSHEFNDNEQFKRWLGETVFALTYS